MHWVIKHYPTLFVWLPSLAAFLFGVIYVGGAVEIVAFLAVSPSARHAPGFLDWEGGLGGGAAAVWLGSAAWTRLSQYRDSFAPGARGRSVKTIQSDGGGEYEPSGHRALVDNLCLISLAAAVGFLLLSSVATLRVGSQYYMFYVACGKVGIIRHWYFQPGPKSDTDFELTLSDSLPRWDGMSLRDLRPPTGCDGLIPQLIRQRIKQIAEVPLFAPTLALAVLVLIRFRRSLYRRFVPVWSPSACRRCGYDLTGNVSGTCPECGRAVPRMPEADA